MINHRRQFWHRSMRGAVGGLTIFMSLAAGCGGPPQVKSSNFRLIEGLQTAVSAEQSQWVEQAAAQIDERHQAGGLADDAHTALMAIVASARAEKWDEARALVTALGKAQKPTSEEIERLNTADGRRPRAK